jgi:hypothetical protein
MGSHKRHKKPQNGEFLESDSHDTSVLCAFCASCGEKFSFSCYLGMTDSILEIHGMLG